MKTKPENSDFLASSDRGYSFKAVNHDGSSIQCQDGVSQEVFPGIFVTVDPGSGIALIEINPELKTAKVSLNGEDVLDLVQMERRDVLTVDGKSYVFLRYMDAYFNVNRKREGELPAIGAKVVRMVKPAENKASERILCKWATLPRRTRLLAVATSLICVASMIAVIGKGGGTENMQVAPVPEKSVPAEVEAKTPTTLNELIDEPSAPLADKNDKSDRQTAGRSEPEPKSTEAPGPVPTEISPAKTKGQARATWIKPNGKNTSKKATEAASVGAPKVNAVAMKAYEREFQEAVLIRGYDLERSTRILRQLRKKVPLGTSLRGKIEQELSNRN